jgi:thymidine kinase
VNEDAVRLDNLLCLLDDPHYKECDTIFIDEGQFFADLENFTRTAVERHSKHIIISALDSDYKMQAFRNVTDLIAYADSVIKLNALCLVCKNGTPAFFSKRLVDNTDINFVGGKESYKSVCRKHFYAP